MSKIRAAYDALIQACKEEGLNASIGIWLHSHLNDPEVLTEEKALNVAQSVTGKDVRHDLKIFADESKGLVSGDLPDHYSQIHIAYKRNEN